MYSVTTGMLPITGANLIIFTLIGGALIVTGLIALRLVYSVKRKAATAGQLGTAETAGND